jgi:hypothetical protein
VNTDAVESRVFAFCDERPDVGQGPADRNSKSDAKPGHRTNSCDPSFMLHLGDDDGYPS